MSAFAWGDWVTIGRQIANHLWQSTFFAAVAGLLAFLLRKNHARVRYWLKNASAPATKRLSFWAASLRTTPKAC